MSQNVFLLNHVICDYSALLIHRRKLTRQLKWCCSSLCTSVLYPPAGKNYSVRIGLLSCHRKKTTGRARWLQNALAFSLRCCDVVIANNNYREVVCAPLPTKQRKTTENGVILPPLLPEEKDHCESTMTSKCVGLLLVVIANIYLVEAEGDIWRTADVWNFLAIFPPFDKIDSLNFKNLFSSKVFLPMFSLYPNTDIDNKA